MNKLLKFHVLAALLFASAFVSAQEIKSPVKVGKIVQTAVWQSLKGQAPAAPALKVQDTGIIATAVENGNYQGIQLNFPQPVDLAQVKALSFDFYQTVRPNRKGNCAIIIYYTTGKGLMGSFAFGQTPWSKCQVKLDLKKFVILGKDKTPTLGKVNKIIINMYRNLNKKGQSIGVKNFSFDK